MLKNISRSWDLFKASCAVLIHNKSLIVYPLYAALVSLLLFASFIVPILFPSTFNIKLQGSSVFVLLLALGFLFYLIQYFIVLFFNAALIGAALMHLEGGEPTVADGLAIAKSNFMNILGYALIASTVGVFLQLIANRLNFIGRLFVGSFGIAFSVATFLTVPILVSRNVGPIDAINESAALLKKIWGQSVVGSAGMGVVFLLFYVLLILFGTWLFTIAESTNNLKLFNILFVAVPALLILAALIHTTLQGIYSAAVYLYATESNNTGYFSDSLLENTFVVNKNLGARPYI